jgi:hypothetical protein
MNTLSLKDPDLLRQQAYIDGGWCDADSGKSFPVTNPATGELLAQVPDLQAAETRPGPNGVGKPPRIAPLSFENGTT